MLNFHKYISIITHPILLPIATTIIFFILNGSIISKTIQLKIISMVAIGTYFVPILILFILKKTKVIHTFEVKTIGERKIPILFMTIVFYILGTAFNQIPNLNLLSQLFIGCSLALITAYIFLIRKIKISLHMIGISTFTAFLIILSIQTNINLTTFLAVLFVLGGIVANARLKLNEHSLNEVIKGYTVGFLAQLIVLCKFWL